MKRFIYIVNARIPTEKAHGIQIMKMCEAFAEKAELDLIIPKRINWIKKNAFDYYGIEKNFKIRKLFCLDLIPFDKYLGHLALWIESATFFIFVLPYILFKKADVIYTRDKFLLAFSFLKKNLVFEAHTFPKKYFLYSLFLDKVKKIIVITDKLKDLFIKQGIDSNKILTAPDGVDLEKFDIKETQQECRKKLNLVLDKKIVLYTGHLYKWKGVQVLADSSQYLNKNILIYFVGGTEKHVKEFKTKNSNTNLIVAGHKPHQQIPYWLKAADVLVLPNSGKQNISKYWTSPIKLFEYMSSKRPIIASDLPSIREILNRNNSVLIEPDNAKVLADGIKNALKNLNFSTKISNQAFKDVQDYTWKKRAGKILRFINNKT